MAETNLQVTAGSGVSIDAEQLGNGNLRQVICVGDPTNNLGVAAVDSVRGLDVFATSQWQDQCVSIVGASGAAVTATLPAVASNFHYIGVILITQYIVATLTASGTPITVTTTNLPGSLAFTFPNSGAIGTVYEKSYFVTDAPIKSSAVNTVTTITAPATTSVLWRITVHYYLST